VMDIFFEREHLKSATEHFRMEQGLQFAFCLGRIRQGRLTPIVRGRFG
jgi:hypothetical protein